MGEGEQGGEAAGRVRPLLSPPTLLPPGQGERTKASSAGGGGEAWRAEGLDRWRPGWQRPRPAQVRTRERGRPGRRGGGGGGEEAGGRGLWRSLATPPGPHPQHTSSPRSSLLSDSTSFRQLPGLRPSPLPRATPLDDRILPSEFRCGVRSYLLGWENAQTSYLASLCFIFLIYKWGAQRGTNP